jgi:hypothetical protein
MSEKGSVFIFAHNVGLDFFKKRKYTKNTRDKGDCCHPFPKKYGITGIQKALSGGGRQIMDPSAAWFAKNRVFLNPCILQELYKITDITSDDEDFYYQADSRD